MRSGMQDHVIDKTWTIPYVSLNDYDKDPLAY